MTQNERSRKKTKILEECKGIFRHSCGLPKGQIQHLFVLVAPYKERGPRLLFHETVPWPFVSKFIVSKDL